MKCPYCGHENAGNHCEKCKAEIPAKTVSKPNKKAEKKTEE